LFCIPFSLPGVRGNEVLLKQTTTSTTTVAMATGTATLARALVRQQSGLGRQLQPVMGPQCEETCGQQGRHYAWNVTRRSYE